MEERRDEMLDEAVLRRSLRLEPHERAPRFDADAIAALARPRLGPAALLGGFVFVAAVGLVASALWSLVAAALPGLAEMLVALLLDTVAAAATLLYPVIQTAMDPAVPLSLLAALGIAFVHELGTRREHAHVHAS